MSAGGVALAIAFVLGVFTGTFLGVLTLALAIASTKTPPRLTVIRKEEDQS